MTAPTINGTRYPQPVEDLLPAARKLTAELGAIPSRNRLMREYRIGAPKADELLSRLREERDRQAHVNALHAAMVTRGSLAERVELSPTDTHTPATDPATPPAASESTAPAADAAPAEAIEADAEASTPGHPVTPTPAKPAAPPRPAVVWPVVLLALPAFVAIWGGWVGLGGLTGFGKVNLLPGIGSGWTIDTAITLPIGVETYGAYALYVWLSGRVPERARRFAKWSAIASLGVGALGQVAYHLLVAAGMDAAPWWITTAVACLPVAVLGMGAALAHLVRSHD
ncbi:ABC transporter permease [Micromonospora globbae]|uniref:ABC transporter permease n=1 Tax=Micromonospora globbae TaxID=1894969 RepID=A0ABZ1SD27_9ACTN|nr:ABC transporter permease [Micromonospora globbae]